MISVTASLLPRMIFKYAQQALSPSDTDIIQEYQVTYWKPGMRVNFETAGMEMSEISDDSLDPDVVRTLPEPVKRTPSVISRNGSIPEGM